MGEAAGSGGDGRGRLPRVYLRGAVQRLERAVTRDPGSVDGSEAARFLRETRDAAIKAGDMRAAASCARTLAQLEIAAGRDLEHLEEIAAELVKIEDTDLHHQERLELERAKAGEASKAAAGAAPQIIEFVITQQPKEKPDGNRDEDDE